MRLLKSIQWVRVYLGVLSSIRAFILGIAMARGLKLFFPHMEVGAHIGFFAVLFIFHWFIVMFYQAMNRWAIAAALLLNSAFALFGRFFILQTYRVLPLQEIAWFGNWYTMVVDLGFVLFWLYAMLAQRKQCNETVV